MSLKFKKVTRAKIRQFKPGEKQTEHGISAERLPDGDVRYSVAVMVDGRRIHRVIGRSSEATTRTQAEEFIARARAEAKEERLSLPKGRKLFLTFEAAADLYLEKLKEVGGRDYVNNEQHIRLHLVPYLGSMRLDHISTFTLQKFQNHCREKGLAETTTNRVLATYRRMGRRLFEWKRIPAPLPMIGLRSEDNRRTYVITDDEEHLLLVAALNDSNSYIWLFIKIGLATGLRHAEILSSRYDRLDVVRRRLRIRAKGGKWRNQPLTKGILDILVREREMAADIEGWIFPSKKSPSGHIESMTGPFARCVVAIGLNPTVVTPHVMRHSAITRLAETGADIKTIQEFSGHESLEMVMRYAHAQDQTVNRALDRMEKRTVVEHPTARKRHDS